MNQKQFGMQGKKLIKDLKNLNTLTFILIFFSILLSKNGFAKENYVVSIVNKIPLTKISIIAVRSWPGRTRRWVAIH